MERKLLIYGGKPLCGSVKVDGSKNALLPLLAACILAEDEFCLENYVDLSDLVVMRQILGEFCALTQATGSALYINTKNLKPAKVPKILSQKLRASIFLLGPMLAKFKRAVLSYPGGCKIGARPIDIHINGFKSLGAKIEEIEGELFCDGTAMHSGSVHLNFPSVGATESLMMCACLLDGETTLFGAAKEPEIVDLSNFLNACGANVYGAGTDIISIFGAKHMHGCTYAAMPDRIAAGTYLLAAATCGGDVLVEGAIDRHNKSLLSLLAQTACKIDVTNDKIRLKSNQRLCCIKQIKTLPYPGFPTDLQAQMMALQCISAGQSEITETLFENRFGAARELQKMGANITISDQTAHIFGVHKLIGTDVEATDLRAGAALVIAGLAAHGQTTISKVDLIDRGYFKIEEKFQALGAEIREQVTRSR